MGAVVIYLACLRLGPKSKLESHIRFDLVYYWTSRRCDTTRRRDSILDVYAGAAVYLDYLVELEHR
eukprot:2902387-Pyramimonas_sp.AAC.1